MTNGKPPGDGSETSEGTGTTPLQEGNGALTSVSCAVCETPEETQALGARFAANLPPGAVVSLEGTLGAGKTQFVKGFAAGRGHAGDVSSPTFTLVHEYAGAAMHFDWYRLEEADEVTGLGWDDYLASGDTLLVEWGDRFPELLPPGTWRIRFEIQGNARAVRWEQAE